MTYNKDKVDEMQLALLYLTMWEDKWGLRSWKGMDWDVANKLFEKGYISDPKNKSKSVALTEEGAELCKKLFKQYFEEE